MSELNEILAERGKNYGEFKKCAEVAQGLKRWVQKHGQHLQDDQKEALEMVMHKVARLLNGDPNHLEGWRDAIGYMTLVYERLKETDGASDSKVTHMTRNSGEWICA